MLTSFYKENSKILNWVFGAFALLIAYFVVFNGILFYNHAGFQTHIQTKFPFNEEKVADTPGYTTKWFGTATSYPREMTVQSVSDVSTIPKGDYDGTGSSLISAFPITFLGGVTGTVDSNVRITLPRGEQFMSLHRSYRNPDNFILQAVMPAMKNTLQSTAQMMSADDYYGGARSEFAQSFADQMADGIYLVKRVEMQVENSRAASKGAVIQDGSEQGEFGGTTSTVIVTQKVIGKDGLPIRLERQFVKLGVTISEANILNIEPNAQFKKRMVDVQNSQAQLMVARQGRQTADEQKKLVTAQGEMAVEEKRQMTLKDQVEQTTNAETAKRLAIINAEREKERAEIGQETAQIAFDTAQIEARTIKELADAEAYKKRVVMQANGNLEEKLKAAVEINKVWATAAQNAPVPSVMMGATGGDMGRQTDIGQLMSIMAAKSAKDLQVDLQIKQ